MCLTSLTFSLRRAISSQQRCPWSLLPIEKLAPCPNPPPSLHDLNMYTQSVWNGILHYLVGDSSAPSPPPSVMKFITDAGLMEPVPGKPGKKSPPMQITARGLDFMLKDVSLQVWGFVMAYLTTLEDAMQTEAILLLSELAKCEAGEGYPVALLAPASKKLMPRFKDFGLIYFVAGSRLFYPTMIAVGLIEGSVNASRARRVDGGVRGAEEVRALRGEGISRISLRKNAR